MSLSPCIPGLAQGWGLMGRTELECHYVPRQYCIVLTTALTRPLSVL